MNTNPFVYLTDNNSNLIQYTTPCSIDQLQLIESTKLLKFNLDNNANNLKRTNFKKGSSLLNLSSRVDQTSNGNKKTNDLIWL